MSKKPQCCKTCEWAIWQRTGTGRIVRKSVGKCTFVPTLPPLPDSITKSYGFKSMGEKFPRSYIDPSDGANCPVYEPKEKS